MEKLTQGKVETAKVPAGLKELVLSDSAAPGLKLRIRTEGARTFIFQRRFAGANPKISIGDAATWILDAARRKARELAVAMDDGIDPRIEKAERREASKLTLGSVADTYLEARAHDMRPRSLVECTRHLRKDWKPLHSFAISNITRPAVASRLRELINDNGPIAARCSRGTLSAMFAWAIGEGFCEANPVIGTNKPADRERERTLTDTELVKIWQACADNGDYGRIVRVLMLTALRRQELGSATWAELDLNARVLNIPGQRTKNNRPFSLPLSDLAMQILAGVEKDDGFIFGRGRNGYGGWSCAKERLDNAVKLEQPWTIHDLRRTCRTGLGKLGVQPHIAEACLNHTPAKLIRTYDRNKYDREMRAAFDQWGAHIESVVSGEEGSNVTALPRGA